MDDLSEINVYLPNLHKNKRMSNPDPNDRKMRRLETMLADKTKSSQARILLKQLTQECISSHNFQ